MIERVFMEVTVPFETTNAGHVRREVGWPLASPPLVNACLPVVPCDITKLVLDIGRVSRDRDRLRNEVGERSLAMFDGDGRDM